MRPEQLLQHFVNIANQPANKKRREIILSQLEENSYQPLEFRGETYFFIRMDGINKNYVLCDCYESGMKMCISPNFIHLIDLL